MSCFPLTHLSFDSLYSGILYFMGCPSLSVTLFSITSDFHFDSLLAAVVFHTNYFSPEKYYKLKFNESLNLYAYSMFYNFIFLYI